MKKLLIIFTAIMFAASTVYADTFKATNTLNGSIGIKHSINTRKNPTIIPPLENNSIL